MILNLEDQSAKMASTREWITFFQDARIPRSAAAQYAMTFTENRISMDMLMDLNKVRAWLTTGKRLTDILELNFMIPDPIFIP